MGALVESGLCMLDFGDSRPASGAEHHASHYWEMKLLLEGRRAILHGAKVGFALIHIAAQYAKIRTLSRSDTLNRLEAATLPCYDDEIAAIRQGYGKVADDVIGQHKPILDLTTDGFNLLKRRIADRWTRSGNRRQRAAAGANRRLPQAGRRRLTARR
jgi:glycerol-1-phosphate dehydrogenase [NAD(P)+]